MVSIYSPQRYTVNAQRPFQNLGNWDIQKKMATAPQRPTENDHHIEDGKKRIYHSNQAKYLADLRLASAQPMRCDSEIIAEKVTAARTKIANTTDDYDDNDSIPNNKNSNKGVRDADQSIFFKLAVQSMNRSSPPQQTPTSQIMQDNMMNLNYDSDYQIATIIVNSLKQNELSTGQEFSAQDLENLIRQRFQGVNDNIVKLAVDMIMNDAQDMEGRIAKTDNNNGYGVLLVSARKPITNQQQQQSQTAGVKTTPAASTTKSWKELRSMIIQGT